MELARLLKALCIAGMAVSILQAGATGAKQDMSPPELTAAPSLVQQVFRELQQNKSRTLSFSNTISGRTPTLEAPDLMYQKCITLKGRSGRCRPMQYCLIPEIYDDFEAFLDHFCLIYAKPHPIHGLCCPNPAPLPESTEQKNGTTVGQTACGKSSKSFMRIVGGESSAVGEFPWMVALMRINNFPHHFCGGTLISATHVLTAAHCLLAAQPWSDIWVRLGEYDYVRSDDTEHVERRVSKFLPHPNYSTRKYVNDIAILTLEKPVLYTNTIRPICLPQPGDLFADVQATVAGWGMLVSKGSVATRLQKVRVPVWPVENCTSVYDGIDKTMLCAGYAEGGKDACQYDSGGPLMLARTGKWFLIGIVSWGKDCAMPDHPGVYTRVNYFLDWIQQNTDY